MLPRGGSRRPGAPISSPARVAVDEMIQINAEPAEAFKRAHLRGPAWHFWSPIGAIREELTISATIDCVSKSTRQYKAARPGPSDQALRRGFVDVSRDLRRRILIQAPVCDSGASFAVVTPGHASCGKSGSTRMRSGVAG